RGEANNKGPTVLPRPPGIVLASQPADAFPAEIAPADSTTGRRPVLAPSIPRPDNPLTARVIVNRIWQHHFGRGLVATTSDFGTRGERPSNQALLDFLAGELIRHGWHLKALHRLMLTSLAYQLSSELGDSNGAQLDPDNRYLWRMNR